MSAVGHFPGRRAVRRGAAALAMCAAAFGLLAGCASDPTRLPPGASRADTLQRGLPGQGATQHFLQISGRPFCLYVVLGSHLRRVRTVPVVNDVLAGIQIS